MNVRDFLEASTAGGAVLFCGAGFLADCLNLSDNESLGVGSALRDLLNAELRKFGKGPYEKLANAADQFVHVQGETALIALLREKFTVSHVTDKMVDIVKFPWERIYTTNYDNAIQVACKGAGVPFKTLSSQDRPDSMPGPGLEVVHLHGCVEKWTLDNFQESCVLGVESYFEANKILRYWLRPLQADFDKSTTFILVGFAMGDFHINQVFYNARDAYDKVFFINRPSAEPNPDLRLMQEKFGTPIAMTRSDFAGVVRDARQAESSPEPVVPSFLRYNRPDQPVGIATVEDIQNLFIFGHINRAQLIRDVTMDKSEYHVLREIAMDVIEHIENDISSILLYGEICCGKTLIVEEICAHLSVSRPVFLAHRFYDTIVSETHRILQAYERERPVIIVENCFSMRPETPEQMLSLFQSSGPAIIMTSRSISARADVSGFQRLRSSVLDIHLARLGDREIKDLVSLSDQAGGWIESEKTASEKARLVRMDYGANIPGFMLGIMKSQFVRARYAEEYEKITDLCSETEVQMMVAACYVSHIGTRVTVSFLSNMFRLNISDMLDRLSRVNYALRIVRINDGLVETVPSIGARNILREIVPSRNPRLIVDTVVEMLRYLSQENAYVEEFERRMFNQLMRYSVLKSVVDDVDEINRFFDHVSKIEYCRTRVLFWLQWHMAMVDQNRFDTADRHLRRSYTEAKKFDRNNSEPYDRVQFDDRKAKFLMIRGRNEDFRMTMSRDIGEAIQITYKLLRRQDLTHHVFDTFVEIIDFLFQQGPLFEAALRKQIYDNVSKLGELMRGKVAALDPGYPRSRGEQEIQKFNEFKSRLHGGAHHPSRRPPA